MRVDARYIETHLAYELTYLLVAATTWRAVHDPPDQVDRPRHLVTLAMESAFVHTRVLYEFLHRKQGVRSPHVVAASTLWEQYETPMHRKVLHPLGRPYSAGERIGGDDLEDRVVDFACDILVMWDAVAGQPGMSSVGPTMVRARTEAVAEAARCAEWFGIASVFS